MITLRCLLLYFLTASLSFAGASTVVQRFVDAFNDHDIDAMLALVADDIRWMNVAGQNISVETEGKDQLRSSMKSYLASIPSARAKIRSVRASGPFIHTVEQAFWLSGDMEKSQCSMAVYEISDGKIKDVWYFSAYACP
jgi:uncharacterized protein (TIGR02246 family)